MNQLPAPAPFPGIPGIASIGPQMANLEGIGPENSNEDPTGLFKRVHQRLNLYNQWVPYQPSPPKVDKYAFIVYMRHNHDGAIPSIETLVQIESNVLKKILKECLKGVAAVFDSVPLINARKLYLQMDSIVKELKKREAAAAEFENVIPSDWQEEPEQSLVVDGNSPTASVHMDEARSDSVASGSLEQDGPVTPAECELDTEVQQLRALIRILEEDFESIKETARALWKKKQVTFDLLWYFFQEGSHVTFVEGRSGLTCAGKVVVADYICTPPPPTVPVPGAVVPPFPVTHWSNFQIQISYIDYNGSTLFYSVSPFNIAQFNDTKEISWLPIQFLDPATKERLRDRGARFLSLRGRHHLHYEGSIIQETSSESQNMLLSSDDVPASHRAHVAQRGNHSTLQFLAAGRVMVDCQSYVKMVPAARQQVCLVVHPSQQLPEIPKDELHFCAPTVFGYSFVVKKWGRLMVDNFKPIEWNAEAFDHLVLAESKKTLIKSIVYADQSGLISDIISTKTGGFIVLLHGKPGTGKTLTAEATAEKAQRPLMVLSAAELGFKPITVELNLRNVLEICKLWNAILLVDEAEVILEERSLGDIQRNAMVSVLLRLLECHQQVIFLTTNHVTCIDPAVNSRIAIAIEYPDLDANAREQIWTRFLKMGHVDISESGGGKNAISKAELERLAAKTLNGRQIKNAMRTAQAISLFKHQPIDYGLMEEVVTMITEFKSKSKKVAN